jgi:hypothetical protein
MNAVFVFHSVSFALADTDFTIDSDWAAGNNELAMKSSLRNGSYSDLNLYFIDVPSLNGDKALGYCYFPESGVTQDSTAFILDGCVVMSETVPGGSMAPYNLGGTAVHEVH